MKKNKPVNKISNESLENNKKDAGNNQWTSNNSKYYDDKRERKDGPGGENGK
ncbi:MAG: hypothetical protein Q8882_01340 [Bacillota bacterium]|nr:hypothetical protein [Bacillota bacterium]